MIVPGYIVVFGECVVEGSRWVLFDALYAAAKLGVDRGIVRVSDGITPNIKWFCLTFDTVGKPSEPSIACARIRKRVRVIMCKKE